MPWARFTLDCEIKMSPHMLAVYKAGDEDLISACALKAAVAAGAAIEIDRDEARARKAAKNAASG